MHWPISTPSAIQKYTRDRDNDWDETSPERANEVTHIANEPHKDEMRGTDRFGRGVAVVLEKLWEEQEDPAGK